MKLFTYIYSFIIQCVFYFGYVGDYFNYKKLTQLPSFYHENIYKYRILSLIIFNTIEPLIKNIIEFISEKSSFFAQSISSIGTPFYISLMLFNTLFLLLCTWILHKIFNLKFFKIKNEKSKILWILTIVTLIGFSEYVVTIYDIISYFFLLSIIYFSYKYFNNAKPKYIFICCVLMFISTLNRETSALNISFISILYLLHYKLNYKEILTHSTFLITTLLSFLVAYIGIRLYFGQSDVVQNIYLIQNIKNPKNLLGIIFFGICIYYINWFSIFPINYLKLFLWLCVPYLIFIIMGGILWEIRLFVPVLIPMIILSVMNKKSWNV